MVDNNAKKIGAKKLAVILIRGMVKVVQPVKDTLMMMKLTHRNHCVVVEDNPASRGMINKVKDFVTWGELDEDTYHKLINTRGVERESRLTDSHQKYTYKALDFKGKKYLTYFRLNSPTKGYGRKGIKISFKSGGALGNRGEKINELIIRML